MSANKLIYDEIMKTARRQLGQYLSGEDIDGGDVKSVFSDIYRPVDTRRGISQRNIDALKNRIEGMSRTKVKNAVERLKSEESEYRTFVDNFLEELEMHTVQQIGSDGNPYKVKSDTVKEIQSEIYDYFEATINEAIKRYGIRKVVKLLKDPSRNLKREIGRLISMMYDDEYNVNKGKLQIAKITDKMIEITMSLKMPTAKVNSLVKNIEEVLNSKQYTPKNPGLKTVEDGTSNKTKKKKARLRP